MTLTDAAKLLDVTRVNLGSGHRPIIATTWRNHDLFPGPGIDDVFDLDGPWPYPDCSIVDLNACHVIEHVKDPIHMVAESERVLRPGGHLLIRVPYGEHWLSYMDMTHLHRFHEGSFLQFRPNYHKETFNTQHGVAGYPSRMVIDEIRLMLSSDAKPYFTKIGKDGRRVIRKRAGWVLDRIRPFLHGLFAELWVYLHKLTDEELKAWTGQGPVPMHYMLEEDSIKDANRPKCTRRGKV